MLVDLGIKPIIVHGGGPQINVMLDKLNIKYWEMGAKNKLLIFLKILFFRNVI